MFENSAVQEIDLGPIRQSLLDVYCSWVDDCLVKGYLTNWFV